MGWFGGKTHYFGNTHVEVDDFLQAIHTPVRAQNSRHALA